MRVPQNGPTHRVNREDGRRRTLWMERHEATNGALTSSASEEFRLASRRRMAGDLFDAYLQAQMLLNGDHQLDGEQRVATESEEVVVDIDRVVIQHARP